MTIFEVVAAVWIAAVLTATGLFGWSEAVHGMSVTADQRAADDCADNAAEMWTAGLPLSASSQADGLTCTVKWSQPQPGEKAVMTIVAQVRNAVQTLQIPNGPL